MGNILKLYRDWFVLFLSVIETSTSIYSTELTTTESELSTYIFPYTSPSSQENVSFTHIQSTFTHNTGTLSSISSPASTDGEGDVACVEFI